MTEIEHNADNFKYVLVIKKNGITNRTEISDWRENQKEINYDLVYSPFEIYVEAYNEMGTYARPAVVHIGYTGEDSKCSLTETQRKGLIDCEQEKFRPDCMYVQSDRRLPCLNGICSSQEVCTVDGENFD